MGENIISGLIGGLTSAIIIGIVKGFWNLYLKKIHGDLMLIENAAKKYSYFISGGNIFKSDEIRFKDLLTQAFYLGKLNPSRSTANGVNWVHYGIAFKYLEGIRRERKLSKNWKLGI